MLDRTKQLTGLAAIIAVLASAACMPPATKYRRTTLTPSALGAVGHQPLQPGQSDLAGSVSNIDVVTGQVTSVGDPALHVAELNAVAHWRYGLSDVLSLGVQGQFAHAKYSAISTRGTPPLKDQAAWGYGPNFGVHLGDHDGLSINTSLALTWFNSPWTEWKIVDDNGERPQYTLARSDREIHLLYRAQIVPHWQINETFGIFSGVSIQNGLSNRGFDDMPAQGSTVEASNDSLNSFVGFTVRAPNGMYVQAQGLISNDEITHTPLLGGQLTLGFQR